MLRVSVGRTFNKEHIAGCRFPTYTYMVPLFSIFSLISFFLFVVWLSFSLSFSLSNLPFFLSRCHFRNFQSTYPRILETSIFPWILFMPGFEELLYYTFCNSIKHTFVTWHKFLDELTISKKVGAAMELYGFLQWIK